MHAIHKTALTVYSYSPVHWSRSRVRVAPKCNWLYEIGRKMTRGAVSLEVKLVREEGSELVVHACFLYINGQHKRDELSRMTLADWTALFHSNKSTTTWGSIYSMYNSWVLTGLARGHQASRLSHLHVNTELSLHKKLLYIRHYFHAGISAPFIISKSQKKAFSISIHSPQSMSTSRQALSFHWTAWTSIHSRVLGYRDKHS